MAELISILTPACNAQAFIYRAVASVIAQRYQEWEMLIVEDDGFNYQKFLRGLGVYDPRIRYLSTNKKESGAGHARNIGLRAASGNWIAPLDADDVIYPDRLHLLISAAQDTGLALDNGYIVDDTEEGKRSPFYADKVEGIYTFDDFFNTHVAQLFFIYRGLIVQGWDEDVSCGADTLFNLRALESAEYARFVAKPLHEYRVHPHSQCQRVGAVQCFEKVNADIIERLHNGAFGFRSPDFRQRIIRYWQDKVQLNRLYLASTAEGYTGNYPQFILDAGRCFAKAV